MISIGVFHSIISFTIVLIQALGSIIYCLDSSLESPVHEYQSFSEYIFICPENQTLHGVLLVFFSVLPGLLGGFGTYVVPIFQGSPEVVCPRVNVSIITLLQSFL